MSHVFQCVDCHTPGECLGDVCRTTDGHRCESCQRDAPLRRPSGDLITEAKYPTRRGATPTRESA
jgi:hypothetical protein